MSKALFVGATSGIGYALREVYQEKGWATSSLDRQTCDLSKPHSVQDILKIKEKWAHGVDLTVFAAGTSDAGYTDALSAADYRRCLEVNFLAPLELFRSLAQAPISCRRFVFVLSGVADLMIPGMSAYGISKRALRDYLSYIRLEPSFQKCHFLQVWPGRVATEFNHKTRIHGDYILRSCGKSRSAHEVALQIYRAEQSNKKSLTLSRLPRLAGYLQTIFPAPMRWLLKSRCG